MCVYICARDTNANFFGKGESCYKSQKEMQKTFKQPSNKLTLKRPTMLSVDKTLWERKSVQPLWETVCHHPLKLQKYILYMVHHSTFHSCFIPNRNVCQCVSREMSMDVQRPNWRKHKCPSIRNWLN